MQIKSAAKPTPKAAIVYLSSPETKFKQLGFSEQEITYITQQIEQRNYFVSINRLSHWELVVYIADKEQNYRTAENCRIAGATAAAQLNKVRTTSVFIANESEHPEAALTFAEGLALANYQFLKYKKDATLLQNSIVGITIHSDAATEKEVNHLQNLVEAVYVARDLVNEPLSYLTAEQLSEEAVKLGKKAKLKVTVFDKKKIIQEGMGGLLAVNAGSQDPPTFTIVEWKPRKTVNSQPIVLVGKGVVYDTGGLSLKPTPNAMDYMKCDMAGAAAVLCAVYAAAQNNLPVHVIALLPATDNRPGENAYTPGDVIKMHNGMTVEVLNTDAEGRIILADALSYAKQYNPELVIDIATLTGAAVRVLGYQGILLMGNADDSVKQTIKDCSYQVYERLAELPLWEEYGEQLKSDIADLKNIGGIPAASITAGMFLQYFTSYPWLHLDMATIGWIQTPANYRVRGGSGAGVRLLYQFLKQRCQAE